MSMMNKELYDALLDAGAKEDKAQAAASTVGDASELATKADIGQLRAETKAGINLVHWMVGFNVAMSVGILFKIL